MTPVYAVFFAALTALTASPTLAEFAKVASEQEFIALISGKKLTRPLVKIEVSPSGQISGTGASWAVTGQWQWQGSYFCRSLEWGGDDLGYNCQEVASDGGRIRFTSDQGAGDAAIFALK
jgi:hypothetical protein